LTGNIEAMNIEELTRNQPFCAGVIITQDNTILVTLNNDLSDDMKEQFIRVGGVGGGQEINETIAECALREAIEELDTHRVHLQSSSTTFFHNLDTNDICMIKCSDKIAPFLLQRRTRFNPNTPYKPGLPIGPYIYYGLYLGSTTEINLKPGDDVDGLLFVPFSEWDNLLGQPTLSSVLENHCKLIEAKKINRSIKLFVPENESFRTVMKLIKSI
jgi:8-oxo-dGTP pyrophosphatase MutT (NUDIX family)